MPIGAIIPAALGVASLIAGNADQKAAQKNNSDQQAQAVANAKAAYAQATQQMQQLIKNDPSPFAGQSVGQPGVMQGATPTNMSGATNPVASQVMSGMQGRPQQQRLAAPAQSQQPAGGASMPGQQPPQGQQPAQGQPQQQNPALKKAAMMQSPVVQQILKSLAA